MAVSQSVSLPWGFLRVHWLSPEPTGSEDITLTLCSTPLGIQRYVNIRRLELTGNQSRICHPCVPRLKEGLGYTSHFGYFSMRKSLLKFQLWPVQRKLNRHFSIIYRAGGDNNMEGKLHLITVVYSLHPLEKFTSLKEISRSSGMGWEKDFVGIYSVWLSSIAHVLLSLFQ